MEEINFFSQKTQELIKKWMKWDKNKKTREEIEFLIKQKNELELEKRLGNRINFGTAGI